ncbi:MAG: TIGR03943 family putative permease subunit [Acidimicrobiia bacterium]
MNVLASSAITALVGIAAIAAAWTGTYTNYVKVGLKWPLIVSGLVLIAAGTVSLVLAMNRRSTAQRHATPGIGALLVVFVAALAVAPPPLGAAAASDRVPNRVSFTEALDPIEQSPTSLPAPTEATAEPLTSTTITDTDPEMVESEAADELSQPQESEPAPEPEAESLAPTDQSSTAYAMNLYEVIAYTYSSPDDIKGVPLYLIGFSAPEPTVPDSFRLTRFRISCCASDAFPLQITLADPPFIPDDDQWVEVEAIWNGDFEGVDPATGSRVPVLEVVSLTPIDPPADPYES